MTYFRRAFLAAALVAAFVLPVHAQNAGNALSASYSATNGATTKIITGVSARAVYLSQFDITTSAVGTVQIEYGTGSTCGTGTTTVTGAFQMVAGVPLQAGNGGAVLIVIPPGQDVCVVSTGTATFGGFVTYQQF